MHVYGAMLLGHLGHPNSEFQQRLLLARIELKQAEATLAAGGEPARRRYEQAKSKFIRLEAMDRMKRVIARRR